MAARVDSVLDPRHLIDGGDDPGRQLVESDIYGVALLDCERAGSLQERHIGTDAALVDLCVEQKEFALLRQKGPQQRRIVGGARRLDVGLAAPQQQREIAFVSGWV